MLPLKNLNFISQLAKLKNGVFSEELDLASKEEYKLLELLNRAREEWQEAQRYFQEVTEPELVDHAIYRIRAAEKKYMYLLKLSHQEKVINNDLNLG